MGFSFKLAFAAMALAVATHFVRPAFKVHSSGIIVITGASTGIGASASIKLASLGFTVLAGVRKESDGLALVDRAKESSADNAWSSNIRPVVIDVTEPHTLAAAATEAASAGQPVVGVFCNAGISAGSWPVELSSTENEARVFAVNYFGVAETVRAFAPLLRASQGRILITGSVAGNIASALGQPYSASKFAMRALADSLRREMADLGVSVSRIEPGFVDTPILAKGMTGDSTFTSLPEARRRAYDHLHGQIAVPLKRMVEGAPGTWCTDRDVVHALTAPRPQPVYHPGSIDGKPARVLVTLMNAMHVLGPEWEDFFVNLFRKLKGGA